MAKNNKQLPIILAIGDLTPLVELNNNSFNDLPVEVVVCHSIPEAVQLIDKLEVMFLIAHSNFFIDNPLDQTHALQNALDTERYLLIITDNEEAFGKLGFLEEKFNIDVFEKAITYRRFRKIAFHLFDNYERNKELNEVLRELEYLKLKKEADAGKIKILTNTISDPVVIVNKKMQVKAWSSESESFFGYSKFEVVNENFLRWLVSPKSHADIKLIFDQVDKSGPGILKREQCFVFRNKLGIELPVDVTISYLNKDTSFDLVFVVRNKNKEIKLEKETIRARELREENKLMRELLKHLGHEFRTPLNAIVGISKTLLSHNAENLSDRQREGVSLVQRSGENMLNLIKDLSGISKLEANKLQLHIETFEFDKLLSQLKTQTLNLIGSKNIKFVLRRSSAIPQFIDGDAIKINQILSNIIGNAVKYTQEGRVTLSSHLIDNKLYFEVSDTGKGIAKDKLINIFDWFSGEKTSSKKSEGVGLGLHITQKLVQLMNGEIHAESKKGVGTIMRFYVSLPAEVKPIKVVDAKPEIEAAGLRILNYSPQRKLILAVDNSLENSFIYSLLSEQDRYAVMLCNNSKVALRTAKEFSPDLLIIKMELPGVHGASIIREIRKRNDSVPVIAFSEYEKADLNLSKDTFVLSEALSLEALHAAIQNNVSWKGRKQVKGAIIVEDDRWVLNELETPEGFIEISNLNEELTQIKVGQRNIEYLIIEHIDQNSNGLSFFLNLLNENKTGQYKQIILHHEAAPMKYLVDKTESLGNVYLMNRKRILAQKFD